MQRGTHEHVVDMRIWPVDLSVLPLAIRHRKVGEIMMIYVCSVAQVPLTWN